MTPLKIEITQTSLVISDGARGMEIPLDRQPEGTVTAASREKAVEALKTFGGGLSFSRKAYCALDARGVSVRRLKVPPGGELEKLLPLQLEREFPLPPEQLSWGYAIAGESEVVVVALKKSVVEQYRQLFAAAGARAAFTLAGLARRTLVDARGAFAMMHLENGQAEVVQFEGDLPSSIRSLTFGAAGAGTEELGTLRKALGTVRTVYVSGGEEGILPGLAAALPEWEFRHLEAPNREGQSAATAGLERALAAGRLPILLQGEVHKPARQSGSVPWRWAAAAAALLIACLALPHVQATLRRPALARKVAEMKGYKARLPKVDRELAFLQYLKTNQAAYLDPMQVLAQAAPMGTKIESLSMNRRGDISLRASMRDAQQAADFRGKLVESGIFSSVVFEEQTPTPDRQKLNIRLLAQWMPGTAPKAESAKKPATPPPPKGGTNAPAQKGKE